LKEFLYPLDMEWIVPKLLYIQQTIIYYKILIKIIIKDQVNPNK